MPSRGRTLGASSTKCSRGVALMPDRDVRGYKDRFDVQIGPATIDDAPAILDLQKLAYHTEAVLYHDWSIPPLTQTLPELRAEFTDWKILKAMAIVLSVLFERLS